MVQNDYVFNERYGGWNKGDDAWTKCDYEIIFLLWIVLPLIDDCFIIRIEQVKDIDTHLPSRDRKK